MITALEIKKNIYDWKAIFETFGIESKYLTGKHSPCPSCGGRDRFRYDNKHGNGDYFCNNCGAGDGLSLIQKTNGWDFATTAKELIEYLGIEDKPQTSYQKNKYKQERELAEYKKAKQLYLVAVGGYKKGRKFTEAEIEKAKEAGRIVKEYEACHKI